MTKPTKTGPHEVDPENVQPITKDQLKDLDKAELEAYMKHYEELCLASYGQTKSGVFKKNPLPTPKQVTFSADPEGLQDMMTKAMHQTMIDQSKVFANTI
jgi:DNA polymerase I-like protein with 3'-5' exonuclease and polymerase domains